MYYNTITAFNYSMIDKNIYIFKYAPCLSTDVNLTDVNTTAYPLCNQTTTKKTFATKISFDYSVQASAQTVILNNSQKSIHNWTFMLTMLYFTLF